MVQNYGYSKVTTGPSFSMSVTKTGVPTPRRLFDHWTYFSRYNTRNFHLNYRLFPNQICGTIAAPLPVNPPVTVSDLNTLPDF